MQCVTEVLCLNILQKVIFKVLQLSKPIYKVELGLKFTFLSNMKALYRKKGLTTE